MLSFRRDTEFFSELSGGDIDSTGLVTGLERPGFEAGSRSRRPSSSAAVSGGGIMAIGQKPDRSEPMESLASTVRGHGPEVVLIHGGMTDGELAWGAQEPLAERWRLRVVDRAG